jgi:hypothetical protein
VVKKKTPPLVAPPETVIDEAALFGRVSAIIENRKCRAQVHVNQKSIRIRYVCG